MHHNMCEGSWNISHFFLHPLLWSNIAEDFYQFYEFSFLITLWFHVDVVWDITCYVWDQEKKVMFVHSCRNWGTFLDIEGHIKFGQWYSRAHQNSDLVILYVVFNLVLLLSNDRCIQEECIFKGFTHRKWQLLEYTPSFVFVTQYSWRILSWCDLSGQYWCHIYFE